MSQHPRSTVSLRPAVRPRRVSQQSSAGPVLANDSVQAPIEMAVRLISETAHDLRSPLASVAATMELIRNGQLGAVTSHQTDCLQAALRQCDYLNTLVGEMICADGLLSGGTTLQRRIVRREEIKALVFDATTAALANKRIELLFDGLDENTANVYVDPNMLCRLLVNLVINAERASSEQSSILIKARDDQEAGITRWSVVDCGGGMSTSQLRELQHASSAVSTTRPQPSVFAAGDRAASTGLGLIISRQLATLHFSNLIIRSREGSGTDVIFDTPLAHPSAVATSYARFRGRLNGPRIRPTAIDATAQSTAPIRIDAPSTWTEITLDFLGPPPRCPARVAIGTITITGEVSAELSEKIDRMLQSRLGRFEMVYRTTRRTWVWALDADHRSIVDRKKKIETAINVHHITAALLWSEPTIMPVGHRSLQSLLVDRMTTQALASTCSNANSTHLDRDSVRLGTEPIAASPIAATRLDEELRRLSNHLSRQSDRLKAQALAIRPPQIAE